MRKDLVQGKSCAVEKSFSYKIFSLTVKKFSWKVKTNKIYENQKMTRSHLHIATLLISAWALFSKKKKQK